MTKHRQTNLFWGIMLILIGGFFLVTNTGRVPDLAESTWAIIFTGLSLLFFVGYFIGDTKNWGLLFPAVGTGAVAAILWLNQAEVTGSLLGGIFMIIVGVPFWVGYLVDRKKNWGALIPAWAVTAIGVIVLFADQARGEWIGALVMFSMALPFFVVYWVNRSHWWALIPGWVMSAIGVIILLSTAVAGEWIGAFVMFSIALPFFVVYLTNRKHWWALIPGYTTGVIGVIILFATLLPGEAIGALVTFGFALPFLYVYWRNQEHWWALIPAGVFVSISLTVLLSSLDLRESVEVRLLGSVMFAGIGAVFALLWLQRHRHGTDWAKYPALVMGAATLLVLTVGAEVELVWSVLLIGLGLWLLLTRSRQPAEKSE